MKKYLFVFVALISILFASCNQELTQSESIVDDSELTFRNSYVLEMNVADIAAFVEGSSYEYLKAEVNGSNLVITAFSYPDESSNNLIIELESEFPYINSNFEYMKWPMSQIQDVIQTAQIITVEGFISSYGPILKMEIDGIEIGAGECLPCPPCCQ